MASEQNQDGAPPSAAALAMNAALGDDDAAGHAHEYLHEQTRLTRLQIEDMQRDERLRVWSFRVRHISDVLWLSFQFAIAVIGLAIVIGLGAFVWNAASSNSLVIEAFSVPPSLAERGLTGQVVASKLLDRLSALQAQTASNRAPSSYDNNWGNDIKVQIPETGVSIGELGRYLREWLGHETQISGEVYHSGDGLTISARVGSGANGSFTGKESDFDDLIQKAAERVYAVTQPYRYAVYLMAVNRNAEAQTAYENLYQIGNLSERGWAAIGLGNLAQLRGDLSGNLAYIKRALAENPDFAMGYINLAGVESQLAHDEQELAAQRKVVALLGNGPTPDMNPDTVPLAILAAKAAIAFDTADLNKQIKVNREIMQHPEFGGIVETARQQIPQAHARLHDVKAMRQSIAQWPAPSNDQVKLSRLGAADVSIFFTGDPGPLLRDVDEFEAGIKKIGPLSAAVLSRQVWPFKALGLAMSGKIADARDLIAKTPADCVPCVTSRGNIETLADNWDGAEHWFAHAATLAPSSPFVPNYWGQMLLAKGDADGAITQLKIAHEKGPHFADPLVYWGEALMLKNRSDLALAKFAEASKDAPNWGRLHLKWGEALLWSGDKAGAQKQFAIAANLHLTPQEKSELAQMKKRAGKGTVQRT